MCVSGLVLPLELETHSQEMFEKYGALGRGYKPRLFDERFFNGSDRHVVHTWDLGGTADVAIRKSVIPQTGMFDETLGPGLPTGVGEDIYMFYRLNLAISATTNRRPMSGTSTAAIWPPCVDSFTIIIKGRPVTSYGP